MDGKPRYRAVIGLLTLMAVSACAVNENAPTPVASMQVMATMMAASPTSIMPLPGTMTAIALPVTMQPYPTWTPTSVPPTSTPRPIPTVPATVPATATPIPSPTPSIVGPNAFRHVIALADTIGLREAGTEGEAKAADYVAGQLTALGYQVTRQPVPFLVYRAGTATLIWREVPARRFEPRPLDFSGSGHAVGQLVWADFGTPADFADGKARGKIALIRRGGELTFDDKVRHARAGGAIAVIVGNNVSGPLYGRLSAPVDLPVIGVSVDEGDQLHALLLYRPRVEVALSVDGTVERRQSQNVVAVKPDRPARLPIIVLGAHFDAVPASPGANDNASGVGVLLELARLLAEEQRAELRFIAFGAEEYGLHGSKAYVERLTDTEKRRMLAMINLDMIGGEGRLAVSGSEPLATEARAFVEQLGYQLETGLGRPRIITSDQMSFTAAEVAAVVIQRPNYPFQHTGEDQPKFVKAMSLDAVAVICLRFVDQMLTTPRP